MLRVNYDKECMNSCLSFITWLLNISFCKTPLNILINIEPLVRIHRGTYHIALKLTLKSSHHLHSYGCENGAYVVLNFDVYVSYFQHCILLLLCDIYWWHWSLTWAVEYNFVEKVLLPGFWVGFYMENFYCKSIVHRIFEVSLVGQPVKLL